MPGPGQSIPESATVLVIGGGPGGSYAAAALAREGIDVVLLEAETFPRYHIGESMLASMRHYLRFIGLDDTFDKHGFVRKNGAAFKLNGQKREGYTDFLVEGADNHAWNVIRSEADELMFKHARSCGAKVFDGIKVTNVAFLDSDPHHSSDYCSKRPISVSWTQTGTTKCGMLSFNYLVDASGRAGILSMKYLKNRKFNQGLKNIACWGYWKDAGIYASETDRAGAPFFEALNDESGWAWFIPLHNGTTSVGVVMNQEISTQKKKAYTPSQSTHTFYLEQLKLAPSLLEILNPASLDLEKEHIVSSSRNSKGTALLISDIKSASDYSYSASAYSTPYSRIVGDSGCFIDPYFSSGVHLALTSALAAVTSICAVIRKDCSEEEARKWYDGKVSTSYMRFLMVVLSAYRQIRRQDQPVLSDFEEDNFDRAFKMFRPVIQGAVDVDSKLSQEELSKTLDFCAHAFEPTLPQDRMAVLEKLKNGNGKVVGKMPLSDATNKSTGYELASARDEHLTGEERRVLKHIRARAMMRTEDTMGIGGFTADIIEGFVPKFERGGLGLRRT